MPRFDGPVAPYGGRVWRLIEGQYRVATVRITDTDAEQQLLEQLLEDTKPRVPAACAHLDYQFWSPFRYGNYPRASRFRRAGPTPGVWYGAEKVLTAVCETVWGAIKFYAASPDTPLPRRPVAHTAVLADIQTPLAVDLTDPAWAGLGRWTDPDDYADCLALADTLRGRGAEAIRYRSVRDPGQGANIAVLTCPAFAKPHPVSRQSWQIMLTPGLIRAHCETTRQQHSFGIGATGLTAA